jgi:hypothetical protein
VAKTSADLGDLLTQARITNKLLVLELRERVGQKELVKLLMNTGATDQEIADVLGTSAATVAVTKARLRKNPGPDKPAPGKKK